MVISRLRLIRILSVITAILAGAHIFLIHIIWFSDQPEAKKLRRFFHLNWEISFASYFSASLLAMAGFFLLYIARNASGFRRQWHVLSFIFMFLSLDEALAFHEELVKPLRVIVGEYPWAYHAWIIVAIPLLIILAIYFFRFMKSLPSLTIRQMVLAGLIYLSGAVGMEILSGYYEFTEGPSESYFLDLLILVEEVLEMTGVILFINALIIYQDSMEKKIKFVFSG